MKNNTYPFTLQPLPYAYDALEPYVDAETMHFHHDKHLQTYVDNLNKALENYPQFHDVKLKHLLLNLEQLPEEIRTKVRNNGGGVFNHDLYFEGMAPASGKGPGPELLAAINQAFGSFDQFKKLFKEAALGRFGSGWAYLIKDEAGKLSIVSTPNQDIPQNLYGKPVLLLDVWEHAYYLKYQNRRGDYIDNWFQVVNWDVAEEKYKKVCHCSSNDIRYVK